MHPLKIYLFKNQIKQIDFAEKIGLSPAYFSKILKYKNFPSRKTALKILELTNNEITMNDIYKEQSDCKMFNNNGFIIP